MNEKPLLVLFLAFVFGCTNRVAVPAEPPEEEPLARTEFSDRIENFFEYTPLKAGQAAQFRIHLTDLLDGTPVEKANVVLTARAPDSGETVVRSTAQIGKVDGIYVAEMTLPRPGKYDIEFHVKNSKLDERLPLSDFKVQ